MGICDVLTRDAARQSIYSLLAVFIFAYAKQLHWGLGYMPQRYVRINTHTYTHANVRVRKRTHMRARFINNFELVFFY